MFFFEVKSLVLIRIFRYTKEKIGGVAIAVRYGCAYFVFLRRGNLFMEG